ncbi:hypothetical protein GALMADRAFT_1281115 [Galerina marginata CBS 339.88]|uniref:Aconitase A/isopropylmalate dehydratase small subunit swivel domain-containing protein n=1 Tax=Galerina marginata (strain CBS 339.88) TaxID=685588 RepID=A0A067T765_GALM3|nr:hypothetical protein GALMADRAFT_1281115 [Galerina marginata CBS 339.88]
MENYDPGFASLVATLIFSQERETLSKAAEHATTKAKRTKQGVILVSGYNFGTGSSREQAATALKAADVPLTTAGSFGDIFKRNAINNGLVCLECPALVADLTAAYAMGGKRGARGRDGELTVDRGLAVRVGMEDGRVVLRGGVGGNEKVYSVKTVGASVQELWLCGGLEVLEIGKPVTLSVILHNHIFIVASSYAVPFSHSFAYKLPRSNVIYLAFPHSLKARSPLLLSLFQQEGYILQEISGSG